MVLVTLGLIVLAMLASFLLLLVLNWTVFFPWMRAFTSGTPVSVLDILGMPFRRTDVGAVLGALIMAKQAGVEIGCREMEQACLQGCDPQKLALAMISARRQGMEVTFEELVAADLEGRLSERLQVNERP